MSRDINVCHGTRFRGVNENSITRVPGSVSCPELGTDIVCTSCFSVVQDLVQHRSRFCGDFNAHVKLHNGYLRQFQHGQAGPHVTQAYNSVSYDNLVRQLMPHIPPTLRIAPRPDPRMRALSIALARPHDRSYMHECHAADELMDMRAVARFVEAHGQVRTMIENHFPYNCPNWGDTYIHRAEYPPAAGAMPPPSIWMSLAPAGQGVAGVGDTGVSRTNQHHHVHVLGNAAVPPAVPPPPGQVNPLQFYQGVPAGQVGHVFNMPGTPRR